MLLLEFVLKGQQSNFKQRFLQLKFELVLAVLLLQRQGIDSDAHRMQAALLTQL